MSLTAGAIAAAREVAPASSTATDWPALIEPVARRLLADRPCREHGPDLRFGARGSMVVHLRGPMAGTWRDFEADASGGTLALVEHLTGRRGPDARAWLADAGLIEPDRAGSAPIGASGHRRPGSDARSDPVSGFPSRPGVSTPPRKPPERPPVAPTADVAAAILAASTEADGTPARSYLAARGTWPSFGIGPDLPAAVRWLPPDAWELLPGWRGDNGRERRLHPPADGVTRLGPGAPPTPCCGAVVYVLTVPGRDPDAVILEAVRADGRRLPWTDSPKDTKRNAGSPSGRVFELPAALGGPWPDLAAPPLAVALVEGPADALALARLRLPGVLVRGAGGTSGMTAAAVADLPPDVPAVLVSDGEDAGRASVAKLHRALADAGRTCYPALLTGGADPDDLLRGADDADLHERHADRAALAEYDGGMSRQHATAAALARLLESLRRNP